MAALATLLVILFQADVHHLIPLYAIGVFTSFTLSQAGMAKRHLRLREPGWKRGLWVNGIGAVASGVVGIVIAVTKFTHGAWVIMLIVPLTVAVLVRVNKHYEHVARMDRSDPALPIAGREPTAQSCSSPGRRRPRPGDALRLPARHRDRSAGAHRAIGPGARRGVLGPLWDGARVRSTSAGPRADRP